MLARGQKAPDFRKRTQHYDQVTQQLQVEGVQKFIDSFQKLFACIDNKRKLLQR